jgi:1-deoxy-D-xylulose-5-phosphate synthase
VVVNGAGSRFAQYLGEQGLTVATRAIGIPVDFLEHGKVAEVRSAIGLTPQGISRRAIEFAAAVLGRGDGPSEGGEEFFSSGHAPARDTDSRRE